MSTCDRCGIGPWHPEAFACTHTDCAIRRAQALPAAAETMTGGRPLAGDARTCVTGTFVDQRAATARRSSFGARWIVSLFMSKALQHDRAAHPQPLPHCSRIVTA